MNGLKFTVVGEVSKEAKEKLEKMMAKQKERLESMIEDFRNGRFDEELKDLPKNTKNS